MLHVITPHTRIIRPAISPSTRPAIRFQGDVANSNPVESLRAWVQSFADAKQLASDSQVQQYRDLIAPVSDLKTKMALEQVFFVVSTMLPTSCSTMSTESYNEYVKKGRRISSTLSKIRDPQYLKLWVRVLSGGKSIDQIMRRAAAENVLRLNDRAMRDEMIQLFSRDSHEYVRDVGVRLIPYHSERLMQSQLLNERLSDGSKKVAHRAKMLAGKHAIRKFLYGWVTLRPPGKPLIVMPAKIQQTPKVTKTAGPVVTSVQYTDLREQIRALAAETATQLRAQFAEKPVIRQVLLERYGSEEHLPKAQEIESGFYQLATDHLKGKAPNYFGSGVVRLFRPVKPEEKPVLELTRMLLETARDTGIPHTENFSAEKIEMIQKIFTERAKVQELLGETQIVNTDQVLAREQLETDYQRQLAELNKQEKAYGEAELNGDPALIQMKQVVDMHRNLLKRIDERRAHFEAFNQGKNWMANKLKAQLMTYQDSLRAIMQYGVLNNTKADMPQLDMEGKVTLEDMRLDKILELVEWQKYLTMAKNLPSSAASPSKPVELTGHDTAPLVAKAVN